MEAVVNARVHLETISTPTTAKMVTALLLAVRGDIFLCERECNFVTDRLQGFANYQDDFELGLAVTQLVLYINSCR